jgi:DNA polymerase III subunit epsilon
MHHSFVAIDFETALNHYVCSVGIVTVEEGVITDEYHAFIQPPYNQYHWRNIEVHGIRPEHTAQSPIFSQVYPEIEKRLLHKTVVAHNESFDRNVLRRSIEDYRLTSLLNLTGKWDCTMKIYRAKGYKPAKLSSCCAVHDIELQHHDALSDARACAKLYLIQ